MGCVNFLRRVFFVLGALAGVMGSCSLGKAAPPAGAPNVLFIISDDLTATALGSYRNDNVAVTPNLDALAANGVQLNNAYTQYPVCGPSRASMMTGMYPRAIGTTTNGSGSEFRSSFPDLVTLPQLFKDNGYTTARVSKIYHMGVPGDIQAGTSGVDDPLSWDPGAAYNVAAPEQNSPGAYEDLMSNGIGAGARFQKVETADDYLFNADAMATTQAISLLNQYSNTPSQPFFLALGMVRPHVPFVAPESYFDPFEYGDMVLPTDLPAWPSNDLADVPNAAESQTNANKYGMTDQQQRKSMAAYYSVVSYMDAQVGRVLDELDTLGMRDNTIVVFTSDHGYNLGEHTAWQKLSLFEDSIRVPTIISVPGNEANQGATVSDVVEMIDLYPTLVEEAGLSLAAPVQGRSLSELLHDPTGTNWTDEAAYTISTSDGQSLRTAQWHYNRWGAGGSGKEELYDSINDPNEYTNLAENPAYASVLSMMSDQLDLYYDESLSIPTISGQPLGDLDFDGSVDVADWLLFLPNLFSDVSELTALDAYQHGDLDSDGSVGPLDFAIFKERYEETNGLGSFESMISSVPEPSSAVLALLATMFLLSRPPKQYRLQ